jgi:acyl carrier protein
LKTGKEHRVTKSEFLKLVDELLEVPPGTLRGDERLDELNMGSLAVIGFIGLVDEHFGISIPPRQIADCVTVNDLAALLGDKITSGGVV